MRSGQAQQASGNQAGCRRGEHLAIKEQTSTHTGLLLFIPGGQVV